MNNLTQINFNNQQFQLELSTEADVSVAAEIFKHREYRIADEAIKNAETIVDIGAHKGFFALYCTALNPKAIIFCVEPEKNNIAALKNNKKTNNLKNVTPVEAAISDHTGDANLVVTADSHNHYLDDIAEPGDSMQKTETYKFSDFLTEYKIKIVSLLKMDIEGGEYAVFDGIEADNFAKIKNIVMEYHNFPDRNYKTIEKQLRENGFGVQVFPSKFDKTMGFIFANNKRI